MNLRETLKGKLNAEEFSALQGSFDVIGSIAKIEIPSTLRKKQKLIAAAIMKINPAVKTVVKKAGIHRGKYRTQKVAIVLGKKSKETTHKESGVSVRLDIEKCYFSVRSASERLRITSLVKKGENVLVMFSGIGIFPLVIARHSNAAHVWGVELNPTAHKYALLNIAQNKIKNITLLKGDVRKVVPISRMRFDRVVMPLPKDAENFLPIALKACKRGGVVHLYGFLPESEIPAKAEEMIAAAARKTKRSCKVVRVVKCGAYASRVYRVCVDIKVR